MTALLLAIFIVLLICGAPIAVCLGLSSAIVIVTQGLPVSVLAQRSLNALDSSPLLAVPLFILAASLLNAIGVTTHLFDLVRMLFGRIRGAVAQVSIFVSLIFSGISGAALADIGALGAVQINQMTAQGYRKEFASGLTIAAATIGPIFPPSIPIIISPRTGSRSASCFSITVKPRMSPRASIRSIRLRTVVRERLSSSARSESEARASRRSAARRRSSVLSNPDIHIEGNQAILLK